MTGFHGKTGEPVRMFIGLQSGIQPRISLAR